MKGFIFPKTQFPTSKGCCENGKRNAVKALSITPAVSVSWKVCRFLFVPESSTVPGKGGCISDGCDGLNRTGLQGGMVAPSQAGLPWGRSRLQHLQKALGKDFRA